MRRLRQLVIGGLFSGFAAATLAVLLFSWIAREVIEGGTQRLDQGARDFVQHIASPFLTDAMRGFTFLGEGQQITELLALSVVLLFRNGRKRAAWLMIVTMVGGLVLERLLKHVFHRTRPEPFFGTLLPSSYSFPSGHALLSCCFFGAIAAMLTIREPSRPVRIAIWTVAALLVVAIGFSRVYLGVHYVSDVIAGYAAAVVWVFSVGEVYKYSIQRRTQASHL